MIRKLLLADADAVLDFAPKPWEENRGAGIGRALVQAAIEFARLLDGLTHVHLAVAESGRDPRLAEAIDIVQSSRRKDGRWSLQHSYKGKTYFELERRCAPSRWNTLRALRVLNWWDRGRHLP